MRVTTQGAASTGSTPVAPPLHLCSVVAAKAAPIWRPANTWVSQGELTVTLILLVGGYKLLKGDNIIGPEKWATRRQYLPLARLAARPSRRWLDAWASHAARWVRGERRANSGH